MTKRTLLSIFLVCATARALPAQEPVVAGPEADAPEKVPDELAIDSGRGRGEREGRGSLPGVRPRAAFHAFWFGCLSQRIDPETLVRILGA